MPPRPGAVVASTTAVAIDAAVRVRHAGGRMVTGPEAVETTPID